MVHTEQSAHFPERDHEERVDELVRMLGGGGDHARTLAQALLQPS